MYLYDCNNCVTKCDGKSKGVYKFKNDVQFSEYYENELIKAIIERGYFAKKTEKSQYPDIEIYDKQDGKMKCYIEVKVQRRTFMKVKEFFPYGNLIPSETMALNLSDLEHYISQSRVESVPIYIMWVLTERPCIVEDGKVKYFYNTIGEFEKLLNYYGEKRRFRRKSGEGDVVDGLHKGVVVNYHFSLSEMKPFTLDDVL